MNSGQMSFTQWKYIKNKVSELLSIAHSGSPNFLHPSSYTIKTNKKISVTYLQYDLKHIKTVYKKNFDKKNLFVCFTPPPPFWFL